jgi:hypothetical protein
MATKHFADIDNPKQQADESNSPHVVNMTIKKRRAISAGKFM